LNYFSEAGARVEGGGGTCDGLVETLHDAFIAHRREAREAVRESIDVYTRPPSHPPPPASALMYVSTQHFPPHTHTPGTLTLPKSLSRSLSLSLSLSHPHTQHPHTHNTHKTYTHTHTQHTAHTQLNYPPPRDELINMSVHELRAHQALLARQIVEEQVSSSFSSVQERYDKGPGCLSPPHTHTHTHT
jgi:hypothetical protein